MFFDFFQETIICSWFFSHSSLGRTVGNEIDAKKLKIIFFSGIEKSCIVLHSA
jgi:hypothetical protein